MSDMYWQPVCDLESTRSKRLTLLTLACLLLVIVFSDVLWIFNTIINATFFGEILLSPEIINRETESEHV